MELSFFVFLFLVFLGLYLQHMEVLGLGVELELQLPAYIHSKAGSETHLRPTQQLVAILDP